MCVNPSYTKGLSNKENKIDLYKETKILNKNWDFRLNNLYLYEKKKNNYDHTMYKKEV